MWYSALGHVGPSGMPKPQRPQIQGVRLVQKGHTTDAESFISRLPALDQNASAGFASPWNQPPRFMPISTCLLRSILLRPIPGVAKLIFLEPKNIPMRERGCTCTCSPGCLADVVDKKLLGSLLGTFSRRDLLGFRNQRLCCPCSQGQGYSLVIDSGPQRAHRAAPQIPPSPRRRLSDPCPCS